MEPLTIDPHTPLCFTTKGFRNKEVDIQLNCMGSPEYTKVSFPMKYGLFSRLETRDHIFEFNLNHEIRRARSKNTAWLHPSEWLKRTDGNDWVYYSSGGYAGVFEALGEYYLPNLTYPTNSLLGGKPFEETVIREIVDDWPDLLAQVPDQGLPEPFLSWLKQVREKTPAVLKRRAVNLFAVSGARVTVMPPDARHTDYQFIPVTIADGCLYKCAFCKVKNKKPFTLRSAQDIDRQIQALKVHYGKDLVNYNALFLGEHDALNAPADLIVETAARAFDAFGFHSSVMKGGFVFLFGSVDALLKADDSLFMRLNHMPFQTFVNIGLESGDADTLGRIGKPITPEKVNLAFDKAQAINDRFGKIEISCNFIMDEALPDTHGPALMDLMQKSPRNRPKGCIYLSPLRFGRPSRELLYEFYRLKAQSRFPTFLYLIQRL